MKQIEAHIMGQAYLLGCPEGGEASLMQAVQKVDDAMCKIRDAGKIKARERIAVLAALNLAFESLSTGVSSPTVPVDEHQGDDPLHNQRMQQLIERIDHTLGQNEQLF